MNRFIGRIRAWLYVPILLIVNLAICARLFSVEFLAYLQSVEGIFIALARQVAAGPSDLRWWPVWDGGVPFQNTYLPLLPLTAGWFSRWTGHSPALSYHQVCAFLFCIQPVFFYLMAWRITRRPGASFLAALIYSLVSASTLMIPPIRADAGGAWNERRLQILVYYGEGPLTASMAILPLALLCLYEAFRPGRQRKPRAFLLAGGVAAMAVTVLFNAFGATLLVLAGVSLLAITPREQFWKVLTGLAVMGGATYALISPLVPPSVLAAIRMNSPTVGGDYRFTGRSWAGVAILAAGVAVLAFLTRKISLPHLRFFAIFGFLTGGIVSLGMLAEVYVAPQPHRYQIATDMAVAFVAVFGVEELLRRKARSLVMPAAAIATVLLAVQFRHVLHYSHQLIRPVKIASTGTYRVAHWLDQHMPGQRVMVSGAYSYYVNDFSDQPQLFGGADPMLPHFIMRVVNFVIYSGMNAGARDGDISILWLKALGAHAIAVPGPLSEEYYKPFAHPEKFEGKLPVLWSEAGDTIYGVPARSLSLAHVVPRDAVVRHTPIHGLDVGEVETYVRSLEDPSMPEAPLEWRDRHTMEIRTEVHPGQALSVQETYTPGWRASVNGKAQEVHSDGLGMIALDPVCDGPCHITLTYDGGMEWKATCAACLFALLAGCIYLARLHTPSYRNLG